MNLDAIDWGRVEHDLDAHGLALRIEVVFDTAPVDGVEVHTPSPSRASSTRLRSTPHR